MMKSKIIFWTILLILNVALCGIIIVQSILGERLNILLLIAFVLGSISGALNLIAIIKQNKKK